MANFQIEMTKTITFVVSAEDSVEAQFYADTHDFSDITKETSDYDVSYTANVYETFDKAAFEI